VNLNSSFCLIVSGRLDGDINRALFLNPTHLAIDTTSASDIVIYVADHYQYLVNNELYIMHGIKKISVAEQNVTSLIGLSGKNSLN
jgi:hypothetical protein